HQRAVPVRGAGRGAGCAHRSGTMRAGGASMLPRWPLLALVVLAGCSHATLPYQPDPQPHGARVSADYQVVGDRLRVEIDTSGRRLEQAWILKPDGTSVAPQTVEHPAGVEPTTFPVGGPPSR